MVAFTDFPERPPDGFVDEVVGVVEEELGEGEGVCEVVFADEMVGGDDGDALAPEVMGFGEFVEDRAVGFFGEGCAEDVGSRRIDQIPIVDIVEMIEIDGDDVFLLVGISTPELIDEDKESGEAAFMKRIAKRPERSSKRGSNWITFSRSRDAPS